MNAFLRGLLLVLRRSTGRVSSSTVRDSSSATSRVCDRCWQLSLYPIDITWKETLNTHTICQLGFCGVLASSEDVNSFADGATKPNLSQFRYTVYWVWLLTYADLLSVARSELVIVPYNTAARQHESSKVIVPCRSDYPASLKWYVQKNPDSEKETLYNGYCLSRDAEPYCTVRADEPGKVDLWLNNTADAAQTYFCLETGTLDEASADIIWISDPICNDSSSEDLVNMTCSIEFRGNWAPIMEWKEQSIQGEKVLSDAISTTTVPNELVTSTFVTLVQEDSRNYTCTTKFDTNGKPSTTTATNVPSYMYTHVWTPSVFSKTQDQTKTNVIAVPVILVTAALVLVIAVYVYRKKKKEQW